MTRDNSSFEGMRHAKQMIIDGERGFSHSFHRYASEQILTESFNKLLEKNLISALTWTLWKVWVMFGGNSPKHKLPLCFGYSSQSNLWSSYPYPSHPVSFRQPSSSPLVGYRPLNRTTVCNKLNTFFRWLLTTKKPEVSEEPSLSKKCNYNIFLLKKRCTASKVSINPTHYYIDEKSSPSCHSFSQLNWSALCQGKRQWTCQTAPSSTNLHLSNDAQQIFKLHLLPLEIICSRALLWFCQCQSFRESPH